MSADSPLYPGGVHAFNGLPLRLPIATAANDRIAKLSSTKHSSKGPDHGDHLVIGAQGVLGGLTAEICRNEGWTVLRGGRRAEDAPDFRLVDLDLPETVATACADADIVINAVEDPQCRAERHVLERGGTILNIATIQLPDRERLRASVGDPPRGRVIFGAGYSGLTAVAAKDLLARHPEADGFESAYSLSIKGMSGRKARCSGIA